MDANQLYAHVQERYGSAAKGASGGYGRRVALAFGYTEEELREIPKDANLGLSCGNPLALAKLSEGETVIDLGSGAGFDVFLAAKRVGAAGKAIGVDMNKDMLKRANQNKEKAKADNVSFVESRLTEIALPDGIADCIISNCVVNLVPEHEKQNAFNEMFRLLKPGGRIAISDILIKRELPQEMKDSMDLYVGCIAGASRVADYESYLRKAGFLEALVVDTNKDLNVYNDIGEDGTGSLRCGAERDVSGGEKTASCCAGKEPATVEEFRGHVSDFNNADFNEWAGSFHVYAIKPIQSM